METFSAASVARVGKKISEVDDALLHPASRSGLQVDKKRQVLQPGDSLWIDLPQGENAVYEISFQLANADSTAYAQLMRNLIFKADFDGRSTVWFLFRIIREGVWVLRLLIAGSCLQTDKARW